jgi:hypothetical protein
VRRQCGRGGGVIRAAWKRRAQSGVKQADEAPMWKRQGRVIRGSVDSGAEGSGPNVGAGSRAGTSATRAE